jgi:hypothetical protein
MAGGLGSASLFPTADSYYANDKLHSGMRLNAMGMGGMGAGVGHSMGVAATQDYSQCLKAATAYGYDSYSPAAAMYPTAQRSYPVMPQPGYTSVIVDPQQYHMTNGYAVH